MSETLRFEPFDTGLGADFSRLSDQFLLDHGEVKYVVDEHDDPDGATQQKLSSRDSFQLETENGQVECGFISLLEKEEDDNQEWIVYITKPPDIRPTLPVRLAEVLLDKEPVREVSQVVEEHPLTKGG